MKVWYNSIMEKGVKTNLESEGSAGGCGWWEVNIKIHGNGKAAESCHEAVEGCFFMDMMGYHMN